MSQLSLSPAFRISWVEWEVGTVYRHISVNSGQQPPIALKLTSDRKWQVAWRPTRPKSDAPSAFPRITS